MESMIQICLEITTFDHADIYGSYTTESDFKHLLPAKSQENSTNF
jgi:predicted oxidoreductase